jgi:hypothetical protein
MTQHVYISEKKTKEPDNNPSWNFDGDFPPLRYVANSGATMVRAITAAWKENKHAKDFVFEGSGHRVSTKATEIPLLLSSGVNDANVSKDAWTWLKKNLFAVYEHTTN